MIADEEARDDDDGQQGQIRGQVPCHIELAVIARLASSKAPRTISTMPMMRVSTARLLWLRRSRRRATLRRARRRQWNG